MILVDASGSFDGYASDITRTFWLGGDSTSSTTTAKDARALYAAVLRANVLGIELVRPGARWMEVTERVHRVLLEELLGMGVVEGSVDELLAAGVQR